MPKRIQSNTNLSSSSSLSLDTPHQNDTQKKTAVSPKTGNIKNAASSSKLKKRKKPHVTILKPRSSSNETSLKFKVERITANFLTHPAYLDLDIYESSSYNTYRMRELKVLTSKEIKTFIKENNIELCSFKDVI